MSEQERDVDHRDRKGLPLDLIPWAKLHADWSYRLIEESALANGRRVITVWEGICVYPGRMFWTAVFAGAGGGILAEVGADTEVEAIRNHECMRDRWASAGADSE